jgi:hypothetical protein
MSVLDQLRAIERHVEQRLRELAPMVAEYRDLEKVAERLGLKSPAEETTDAPPASAPRRPARAKSKARTSRGSASTAARGSASRAATRKPTASAPRSRASAAKKTASASTATKKTASASMPSRGSSSTRAKTRPAAAATGSAKGKTVRRRRRTVAAPGSRQQDVVRLVNERPGISVAEIAKELGVDATGLYGIVRRLQAKAQIRKDGTALRPVDAAAPTAQSPAAPSSEPTGTQPSATQTVSAPPSPASTATDS